MLWAEGVREVADTVDRCHAQFCAYHVAHWSSALGLDCFQEAKLLTTSFPLLPDLLALAHALAAEACTSGLYWEGEKDIFDTDIAMGAWNGVHGRQRSRKKAHLDAL